MIAKRWMRRGSRVTTVTVSPSFQVVIPRAIRDAMDIRPGQRIHALQYEDRIELIPLRSMRQARGMYRGIDMNVRDNVTVKGAQENSYMPRTELGRRLAELRKEGIRSGMKLLTACEINEELTRRRGEACES